MRQTVELEVDGRDDPVTVTYTAVDLRRYEAWSHKSVLIEPMSMTMLTFLGWSAAVRTGQVDGDLKDWKRFDEACVGVKTVPVQEDEEARPTQPTVGDD